MNKAHIHLAARPCFPPAVQRRLPAALRVRCAGRWSIADGSPLVRFGQRDRFHCMDDTAASGHAANLITVDDHVCSVSSGRQAESRRYKWRVLSIAEIPDCFTAPSCQVDDQRDPSSRSTTAPTANATANSVSPVA